MPIILLVVVVLLLAMFCFYRKNKKPFKEHMGLRRLASHSDDRVSPRRNVGDVLSSPYDNGRWNKRHFSALFILKMRELRIVFMDVWIALLWKEKWLEPNNAISLPILHSHQWPRQNSSSGKVVKITKNINKGITSWSNTKFSAVNKKNCLADSKENY